MLWYPIGGINEAQHEYLLHAYEAPDRDASPLERLKHFEPYLEHSEPRIACDALCEFKCTEFENVAAFAPTMDADLLREWAWDEEQALIDRSMYLVLLAFCGTNDDALHMREEILQPIDTYRPESFYMMYADLMLSGEEALVVLEQEKLANRDSHFSETYAAIRAIEAIEYSPEQVIPTERLAVSIRLLLDHPELGDIAVSMSTRFKDWSLADQLFIEYSTVEGPYAEAMRIMIIRYYLTAQGLGAQADGDEVPDYAEKATQYLRQITVCDPARVENTSRYFRLEQHSQYSSHPWPGRPSDGSNCWSHTGE